MLEKIVNKVLNKGYVISFHTDKKPIVVLSSLLKNLLERYKREIIRKNSLDYLIEQLPPYIHVLYDGKFILYDSSL